MGATIHIVTGSPGNGLNAEMLARYQSLAKEPGTTVWLVPSQRATDEILHQLAAAGKPVLAPNVMTLECFALKVLGQKGKSKSQQTRRVEEATRALVQAKKAKYFAHVAETRGFVRGAEGLIEELESLGVGSKSFAAAIRGRGEKLKACAELYSAVTNQAGPFESAVLQAAREIAKGLPPSYSAVRSLFLSGFTFFNPVKWELVKALSAKADLWISLPIDDGDRAEAFASTTQSIDRLKSLGSVNLHDSRTVTERPAGLAHLDQYLFGAPVEPSSDATGIHLIEAAGTVGEARLVARRIRTLLAAKVRPDDIVVTARDMAYSLDLLGEVFDEYGIPVELDGDEAITRNSAVATLLRALRLPEDNWPFAGVTALLRSTYFRPAWPEYGPDAARHAEGLLRLLGEPHGREAYLRAVKLWAETPPLRLEDEQAEESRRVRKMRLANQCQPFLERFFQAWDEVQAATSFRGFASAVREFAHEIGLEAVAAETGSDRLALQSLWTELENADEVTTPRTSFVPRLANIASSIELPRSPRTAGRVRIVSAEEARHLNCDYLFILGLGEKSFPQLSAPESLLDDSDRVFLREAGLPFTDPTHRLGREQLSFLELVARPRRELVFSFAAVDAKGQPLLPGTFLRAVRECFQPTAIVAEQQKMLIEGYFTQEPLSAAEARSRYALAIRESKEVTKSHPDLPRKLCDHLGWARQVATARFRTDDYTRYDGWLGDATVLAAVSDRFGPKKVFSPTALESYVSCPFRFFLEQVIGLEELDEPGEEVEHTRRGAAYHRALSRLHQKLRAADPEMTRAVLPDQITADLRSEIDIAVQEYADRAPSPASRKLWELEGMRLQRSVAKYRGHWEGFVEPWRKVGAALDPRLLEADFGLPAAVPQVQGAASTAETESLVLNVGGVEVRIGGRIDRVDVAEVEGGLGFWVIDYKTGRAVSYTASELARFEKLQLPLYALAVERVFFPGRQARPLGLAYWLVTDSGPKTVSPGVKQALGWLNDPKKWATFRKQLEEWVAKVVGRIREGHFPLAPRSEHCTDRCSFGQVCRISQSRNVGKVWELSLPAASDKAE